MEELNWYKFTEHNDNEGETWHFFIQLTQQEHNHIFDMLNNCDGLEDYYQISDVPVDETELDVLVKHTDSGYMDTYNKVKPPYKTDILKLDEEEAEDWFYKGRIWLG
jgi:hypothetical protein